MKLALISSDDREPLKRYHSDQPIVPAPQAALLQGLAKQPGLEVHFISCLQQPVRSPEQLADNVWFHPLRVPKSGWMRTLYQGCIRAMRKKLREIKPDIVHGQGTERDCAISAVFSGFPNVVTIHGNMRALAEFYRPSIGSYYWLASRLETFALRRTDGVLCNSAYTERLVAPRARRIWRAPNALRAPFLDQPATASRPALPVLLNAGSLVAYKRQTEILAVARKLWQRGFRFELQFAGDTHAQNDYTANFLRQLREAESAGYARHLGVLALDELIRALDAASALVHFPTEEAFGLVVAESLARNLKLFASAIGGVPDIAAGVEGAELFPPGDWTVMENAIARWMEAGSPRPAGAAAVMRRRYAPEVIARRHVEIYREVLSTPGYENRKS
jgi:glycosyltransferase involved in cell wall biosynthesis